MKRNYIAIVVVLLFAVGCSKPEPVEIPEIALVDFTTYDYGESPDTGLTMPTCSNTTPALIYIKYRYLGGGKGEGYFSVGEPVEFNPEKLEIKDFKVLTADRKILTRMPRIPFRKAFVISPELGGTIKVEVPVSCIP